MVTFFFLSDFSDLTDFQSEVSLLLGCHVIPSHQIDAIIAWMQCNAFPVEQLPLGTQECAC